MDQLPSSNAPPSEPPGLPQPPQQPRVTVERRGPCPHCGSARIMHRESRSDGMNAWSLSDKVLCGDCGTEYERGGGGSRLWLIIGLIVAALVAGVVRALLR